MAPRTLLRYEQIRRRSDQPDVQASDAPFTEGRYFEASCLSTQAVNDCVKVIGTNGGGRSKIRLCDPNDAALMPMTGIVVEKTSPQVCLVQVSGLITSMSGLIAGEPYFVGPAGTPVAPDPLAQFSQIVGVAIRASQLLLYPNQFVRTQPTITTDVYGEFPIGALDGVNTVFATIQPFLAGTLRVYYNGVRLHVGVTGDYVETSASSLTLAFPPRVGDTLLVDYRA